MNFRWEYYDDDLRVVLKCGCVSGGQARRGDKAIPKRRQVAIFFQNLQVYMQYLCGGCNS